MVRLFANGLFWIIVTLAIKGIVVDVFGVYFIPYMSFSISVMSVMFPQIMDMGVDKYAKANLYDRLWPLVVVAIILYVSKWFTATYVVAIVNSYYLGVATAYISKVFTEKLERSHR